MGCGFQTIGLWCLHFPMRKWPSSLTILSSQWQGCTTPASRLTFGLRQLWIWTQSSSKDGCRFCTIRNCVQQQGMQTTLQEWRLLFSRTSNASIFICEVEEGWASSSWPPGIHAWFWCWSLWHLLSNTEVTAVWTGRLTKTWAQLQDCNKLARFTKTKPLTATIHTNKRRNFASERILVPSGAVLKVVQMANQGLTALVYLAERTGVLESVLGGRVPEECLCMYNVDGSMWKIVKSKLFEQFHLDPVTEELEDYISRIDMGMIWHLATPTHDDCEARKRGGSEYRMDQSTGALTTWKWYVASSIHDLPTQFPSPLPMTDTTSLSIKDDDHDWRAAKWWHIIPKPEGLFPDAAEFNHIMMN